MSIVRFLSGCISKRSRTSKSDQTPDTSAWQSSYQLQQRSTKACYTAQNQPYTATLV